jgi:tetratricopeptide (TPR) repeat protein
MTLLLSSTSKGQAGPDTEVEFQALVLHAKEAQSRGDYQVAAANYQQILKLRPELAEVRANLGLMQHLLGEYGDAIQTFEAALRQKPDLIVPNLFLGLDLLRLEQPKHAIPYLQHAQRLNPRDEQATLGLAQAYVAVRQFAAAYDWYSGTVEINPGSGEAWYGVGLTCMHLQESATEQLAQLGLDSIYSRLLYAESMEQQERWNDAVALYRRLLESHPDYPGLHAALGFAYVRQGDLSAAREQFKKELGGDSVCLLARLGLARLCIEEGDVSGALKELDGVWNVDSGFLESNAPYLWNGLNANKIEDLQARLKSVPGDVSGSPVANYLVSAIERWREQPVDTFPRYQPFATASRSSDSSQSITAKPSALYSQGRFTQCTQNLRQNLNKLAPSDSMMLAECSYYSGDYQTTFLASARLVDADSKSRPGLFWRARAGQKLAVYALLRAGSVDPGSYRVHLLLADAHAAQQHPKEAEMEYRKALELKPGDPAAHFGLGKMYCDDLKFEKAVPELEKVLQANPADPEASYLMAEVLVYRHQYSDALPYLKAALQGTPSTIPRVHALFSKVYAAEDRTTDALTELEQALWADRAGNYHYQLYVLYRKLGHEEAAAAALKESERLRRSRQSKEGTLFELQTNQ